MLNVNNLEVVFNKTFLIIQGISINVPDKEIIGLLGANGAGKTTTLKAICGLLIFERGEVTDGTITLNGEQIQNTSAEKIVRMGLNMVPENRLIFDELTVEENLMIGSFRLKINKREMKRNMERIYDLFPSIVRYRTRLANILSGGEQQMLAIGRALMANPETMLMDEASLGLSPILLKGIFRTVTRINKEDKVSILLVEQNATIAFSICQYIYIMENGKIVLDGDPEKLRKNEDVKVFYLGGTEKSEEKISFHDVKHYKRRKRWLG